MKVINLYGGPGAGKSTVAAGLFSRMKIEGHYVELVTEFARDEINSGSEHMLQYQDWIFAQQHLKLARLEDRGVDYVITDSPLLLVNIYAKKTKFNDQPYSSAFNRFVVEVDRSYDSINYFIQRRSDFQEKDKGRVHDLNEALAIDNDIQKMLNSAAIPYTTIPADETASRAIYSLLMYEAYEVHNK